jgi:hypothetical protein
MLSELPTVIAVDQSKVIDLPPLLPRRAVN